MLNKLLIIVILFFTPFFLFADSVENLLEVKKQDLESLRIEFPSRCMMGDFDLIAREIINTRSKLVFSLENYSTKEIKSFEVLAEKDSGDIFKGYSYDLKAPFSKKGLYLVYLCKESNGITKCSDKKFEEDPIEALNKFNVNTFNPANPLDISDKNYYFNYIIFDGKNIKIPVKNYDRTNFSELRDVLVSIGVTETESLKMFEQKMILNQFPFRYDNNSLIIDLPRYDPDKCNL